MTRYCRICKRPENHHRFVVHNFEPAEGETQLSPAVDEPVFSMPDAIFTTDAPAVTFSDAPAPDASPDTSVPDFGGGDSGGGGASSDW